VLAFRYHARHGRSVTRTGYRNPGGAPWRLGGPHRDFLVALTWAALIAITVWPIYI